VLKNARIPAALSKTSCKLIVFYIGTLKRMNNSYIIGKSRWTFWKFYHPI